MKLTFLRSACAIGLTLTLAACGAGNPADAPYQTAALMQVNVQAGSAAATAAPTSAYPAAGLQVANANMPQPDCAADGCKSLRIIDANAEAFRYQAMQRAANPQI